MGKDASPVWVYAGAPNSRKWLCNKGLTIEGEKVMMTDGTVIAPPNPPAPELRGELSALRLRPRQ